MKILSHVVATLTARTEYFLQVWRIITSYSLILEIFQRFKIPFVIELEQKNIPLLKQEAFLNKKEADCEQMKVWKMSKKGSIQIFFTRKNRINR